MYSNLYDLMNKFNKRESDLDSLRTLVLGHLSIDTLVSKKEGCERERVGGMGGKEKQDLQQGGNK